MRQKRREIDKCHPLVPFAYVLSVMVAAMFTVHPVLVAAQFIAVSFWTAQFQGWRAYRKKIPWMLGVTAVTTVGNMILSHDGEMVLWYALDNAITVEAMLYGMTMGMVLVTVLLWISVAGNVLTMDKILAISGRIFPSLTLTISTMLRYLPLLKRRYRVIRQAQNAMGRGIAGSGVSLFGKIRQRTKEFSILISWSLENAIDTADSMESRGYGSRKRTSFVIYRFTGRDGLRLAVIFPLGTAALMAVLLPGMKAYYYPTLWLPPLSWQSAVCYGAYLGLLLYPAAAFWTPTLSRRKEEKNGHPDS